MASIWQDIKERKILDKDGKVDPLGPYGKQKLTGQEVAQYFRKNKVSDAKVKRAVEVALDLGGADTIARKEIKKFFGDRILKSKEVQNALKYANEEVTEGYKDIIKMFPRDNDWKKLITKHRKNLDDFHKGKKDLDTKVEDDLITWALDNDEIRHKEDVEDFIDQVLNASYQPKGNSINELNGQTGPVLNVRYRPGRGSSHSTIQKSQLYDDIINNKKHWSITANTNSLEFRLPHPKGRDDDKKDFQALIDGAKGNVSSLIRGGGLTKSEVMELKRDYEKAIKAFKGDKVVSQDHSIYVSAKKPGGMKVEAGLLAMLKALDEFGMRNHVSVSGRDNVLTQIQDAGQYESTEHKGTPLQEKVEYVEYKFRNKNDAQKALDYFKKQNLIKLDINDDNLNGGEIAVDAGKKDMSKYHKEVIRKFKPKVQVQEGKVHDSIIRRDFPNVWAASAKDKNVLKNFHAVVDTRNHKKMKDAYKKDMKSFVDSLKEQNIMNTYRQMWEDGQKYAPETVSEGKEFKQSDIDKVAKLTDRNEHTKSLIHIAKVMGDKRSFKKLELIDKLHNEYGHLHSGLKSMRDEVYQDLKDGMKKYDNGQDMYGAT